MGMDGGRGIVDFEKTELEYGNAGVNHKNRFSAVFVTF